MSAALAQLHVAITQIHRSATGLKTLLAAFFPCRVAIKGETWDHDSWEQRNPQATHPGLGKMGWLNKHGG